MVRIQQRVYWCRSCGFLLHIPLCLLVKVTFLPFATSFIPGLQISNTRYKQTCQDISTLQAIQEKRTGLEVTINNGQSSKIIDEERKGSGFYIHIPYCRKRCRYCDFPIVPIGTRNQDGNKGFQDMDKAYCDALLDEIDFYHAFSEKKKKLSTIYFGGGTPSLAPITTIRSVVEHLCHRFEVPLQSISDDEENTIEITMEMDPGTFTKKQLEQYKHLGINRISLGVQALNDTVLEQIGRVHRVKDVYQAVDILKSVFRDKLNYSIDLISGLPGITLAEWSETLERVVRDLKPTHLSIYDLQIEEGTVFGRWYANGDDDSMGEKSPYINKTAVASLPSPEECAYMYCYASGYLTKKGYQHYEISSYSQSDKRSRHNQIYWGYQPEWYAIGLGATSSYPRSHRFTRPRIMSDYLAWVKQQKRLQLKPHHEDSKKQPPWLCAMNITDSTVDDEDEREADKDQLSDIIMTRLRTSDGLNLNWLEENYSKEIFESVLRGAQLGVDLGLVQIEIGNENNTTRTRVLRLVDPQGFLFSNTIISSIFVELSNL
mmetsp:Transcript_32715/g.49304  ORF Transcript_32715/g.49304 Transcript_32715/m.49304 type:complete len:545 (+) Transcript_32715:177-1811(+)